MRMFRGLYAGLILGALILLAAPQAGRCGAASSGVTIRTETYDGWRDAYRLSNGIVDLVVVPSIGRIMAFEFTGQPQTNPLFNNPLWAGKPAPPAPDAADPETFPSDWHNYGGDKVWPSEQSGWPHHQPVAWPPDPALDTGPYQATVVPSGLRLAGPVSPYFGVRLVREIALSPGQARVTIHDTFEKAKTGGAAFPIGLWSISQVRGDSTIYLPLYLRGTFAGVGFIPLGDSTTSMPNWQRQGSLLAVKRPSNIGTKVGVDDRAGWAACLFGGNLLFSEHFTRQSGAAYPDKGADAEVFTNGDDTQAYMELEVLGPLVTLRPGQTLSRQVSWRLQRLPQTPTDPAAAVRAAMRRR